MKTFGPGLLIACLTLVHLEIAHSRYVDLGLCNDWHYTCQCGQNVANRVTHKIKQCTAFRGFKTTCKPCDDIEPKDICPRFQHCLSCEPGVVDRCLACPKNRFGTYCSNECDCKNGGRCDSTGKCKCLNGFEGLTCETPTGCQPPYAEPPVIETRLPRNNPLFIEYECPPHQQLIGVSRISCLATREWSHRPPTCRLTCEAPDAPRNGARQVARQSMALGDMVTFTCDPGYTMFGQRELTCQDTAELDGPVPECAKVSECPQLAEVGGAVVEFEYSVKNQMKLFNGTKVHYRCREELTIKGSEMLSCTDQGVWSGEPPKCIMVSDIHVHCNTTGNQVMNDRIGLIVRIRCPPGCAMTNDSVWGTVIYNDVSSVCRSGVHSGKITNVGGDLYVSNGGAHSDFLGSTMNGVTSDSKLTQGHSFRFHKIEQVRSKQACPEGWTEVEGFCSYRAPVSKAWEMSKYTCHNMGSKLPTSNDEAFVRALQRQTKGSIQTWLLDEQTLADGEATLWDAPTLDTEESQLDHNGTESFEEESPKDLNITECAIVENRNDNFVAINKECSTTANFICFYPLMEEVEEQCEDPGTLANGFAELQDTGFKVGSVIKYSCKELHYISGPSISVCTDNLTWSNPKPRCIKINTCLEPPKPKYGTVEILAPLEINANSARNAAKRFRIARPIAARASRAGSTPTNATIEPIPTAITTATTTMPPPLKDILLPPGHYKVGTRASYACESRYYDLIGSQTRRCQTDGTWSGRPATCLPVCGRSDSPRTPFVVNGNSSEIGQWPWQVAISKYLDEYQSWFLLCGGALLNEQWVVTAAHCVTTSTAELVELTSFRFQFGKYHRKDNLDDEMVQIRTAKEIHVHPYYDPVLYDADIALIQLDQPVDLNTRVQPVCLPTDRSTRKNVADGKKGVVTGWGLTENEEYAETLRQAVLPVVGHDSCELGYEKAELPLTVSENMFCAGYEEGNTDACNGDSGGPMVFVEDNGQRRIWMLEGIVSWGSPTGCGYAHQYGGFTRVSKFLEWIYQFI